MGYKEKQCDKQQKLISSSNLFDGAKAGKEYRGKSRDFILIDGKFNICNPIRNEVIKYFTDNGIQWWGGKKPSGHVLSSQIACINHLFPIREEHDLLLNMLNKATNQNFKDLLPIPEWLDKQEENPHYVAFEAVSKEDHLNEVKARKNGLKGKLTRGSNCTSVDALMIAKKNEGVWLIPIEWKYTELYANEDKSKNKGGKTRLNNYKDLIQASEQLKEKYRNYEGSIYFQEPYYQLMRQTIWAESSMKDFGADKFIHLHIVPEANKELLNRSYKRFPQFPGGMEETWQSLLKDPDLYLCKDQKTIFASIKDYNSDLYNYLLERYWKE